ncbi:histidine phosphatase family protein [Fodinibius sediminis]|uniref:Probable phosphoglycerate mutase n=1 Tax=Fodinibius sediminis TaxID=1214077 RepID=A0A521CA00_9BACT|nr:histidine phosphatase family protein [Fodinibius sediminis]SMO56195.1 probable phosphoglycerate mutase [Fodinibius sediminis]
MSLTNVFLVRHGETEYNRRNQIQGRGIDAPLNNRGRQQARAVAQHLKEQELHHIFSSSLKRSRETAECIAQACSLTVEPHGELDEMDFGVLEGRSITEIETELQQLQHHWKSGNVDFAFERAESPRIVLKRAATRAEQIIRERTNSNMLFVLHGRLIRILLAHWLKRGLSSMHQIAHSNASLYHLQWDGEQFEAVYLNNTDHLQDDQHQANVGS